jgi:exosortase K
MPFDRGWWERTMNVALVGFALGLAWALKDFYSHARFEDLRWVMAPTRRVVEWLTGAAFEPEPGAGYLSRDHRFAIVPACAGVNFMIVAFASLACGLAHTCRGLRDRLRLLAASALAAWAVTVAASAVRIACVMGLHGRRATLGPLSPAELRDAVGAAIYLIFLFALFAAGARLTGARRGLAL